MYYTGENRCYGLREGGEGGEGGGEGGGVGGGVVCSILLIPSTKYAPMNVLAK